MGGEVQIFLMTGNICMAQRQMEKAGKKMDYRHELKFMVSDMELTVLRYRLMPLMHTDVHQENGAYTIRSLYFDDFYDTCMRENEDGVDNRKKYRIRIYNGSREVIKLEKKMKHRDMTRKMSVSLPEEICRTYVRGEIPQFYEGQSDLEKELLCEVKMHGMQPKSIVEYERTAFVEPRGNVRITFDRNISGSSRINEFMERELTLVPLLPAGQHILEVKYDELLPQYIADMLEIQALQQISFSKYYYSRLELL